MITEFDRLIEAAHFDYQEALHNAGAEIYVLNDTLARLKAELAAANERVAELEAAYSWQIAPEDDPQDDDYIHDLFGGKIYRMRLPLPPEVVLSQMSNWQN